MITLTEILGRAEQGMTRPFVCRAAPLIYYVKGAYAGQRSLWLQNEDRSLSALGGNPNLLVEQIPPLSEDDPEGALWKDQTQREMLWAYDFNLAFDEDFNREQFFGSHVFGETLEAWPEGFREAMEPRLLAALSELDVIFEELPLEWLHVDGDESLPVQLDREKVRSALELPFREPDIFWKLP